MAGGMGVVAALWVLSCAAMVASAAKAPPQAVDCSVPFNDLMPCIEFVNSNSSAPPSAACCAAFSTTQKERPECLCQLQQAFADPATAPGNVTRAVEIPVLCKVAVDYNKCPALLGLAPASAPAPAHSPAPPPAPSPSPRHAPSAAPVPAPGPGPRTGKDYDCTNSINELTSCLVFVSGNGTGGPPKDCCTAIGSVQSKEPVCICQLVAQASDGAQYGINATLAMELPSLCHVASDTSKCATLLNSPLSPSPSPGFAPAPPFSIVPSPAHTPAPAATPASSSPVATPAPAQSVDCSNEYELLQYCFAYVMANDTAPPSAECCTSFGSVVAKKPVCLCQLLQTVGSGDPATAGINATRALELPTVCKVAIDVAVCPALLGQPVSSPLPSTADTPGSTIGSDISPVSAAPAPTKSGASSVTTCSSVALLGAIFWSISLPCLHFC